MSTQPVISTDNWQPAPAPITTATAPLSVLNLYEDFIAEAGSVAAARALYFSKTGQQAKPFVATDPVKGWFDPSPSGQPYSAFDIVAGKLITMPVPEAIASTVNLPGLYNYSAYVETPTDAVETGPYGMSSPISPATVSLEADAQAFVASKIAPLFPGKSVTVVDGSEVGVYAAKYGTDPRRQWVVLIDDASPAGPGYTVYVKTLMLLSYVGGEGASGHFVYDVAPGAPANDFTFQWVPEPQVTTAPSGALTLPTPIRSLLPDETFQYFPPPNPMFASAGGTWKVVRSDAVNAAAQLLATVEADLTKYNEAPGVAQQLALTPVVVG